MTRPLLLLFLCACETPNEGDSAVSAVALDPAEALDSAEPLPVVDVVNARQLTDVSGCVSAQYWLWSARLDYQFATGSVASITTISTYRVLFSYYVTLALSEITQAETYLQTAVSSNPTSTTATQNALNAIIRARNYANSAESVASSWYSSTRDSRVSSADVYANVARYDLYDAQTNAGTCNVLANTCTFDFTLDSVRVTDEQGTAEGNFELNLAFSSYIAASSWPSSGGYSSVARSGTASTPAFSIGSYTLPYYMPFTLYVTGTEVERSGVGMGQDDTGSSSGTLMLVCGASGASTSTDILVNLPADGWNENNGNVTLTVRATQR